MGLTLYKGRPENLEGRLEKEIRVYDFLDQLGIEYCRLDHEPAMTMEVCQDIEVSLGATICKNLFLSNRQQTSFYLLVIDGDKMFRTKEISAQIGSSRLSFGDASFMEEYLDITPGSVSVMGLMNDRGKHVKLLVDEDVLKGEYFGCHPCINTSSLKVRTKDVFETFLQAADHDMTMVSV